MVMDTDKYVTEILRQIEDTEIFEKLSGEPTKKFQDELFKIIADAQYERLIDEDQWCP